MLLCVFSQSLFTQTIREVFSLPPANIFGERQTAITSPIIVAMNFQRPNNSFEEGRLGMGTRATVLNVTDSKS